MEIKILKNSGSINSIALKNNMILEINEQKSQYKKIKEIKLNLFDLNKNKKIIITNMISKYDVIDIVDCTWESNYIFYFSFDVICEGKVNFRLHRYNYFTHLDEIIYSFFDELKLYFEKKKATVFVLNENNIIIQFNENGVFESFLYKISEDQEYEIFDENILSNGIKEIIPFSENVSVLKTGFSDCVESIFVINILQLISDIILMKKTIQIEMIEQCYKTSSIHNVGVKGSFLFYSVFNKEKQEEKIVFYDLDKNRDYSCINQNINEISNLSTKIIIENTPYIKLETLKGTEFFNVIKSRTDFQIPSEYKYNNVFGNIIVVSGLSVSKFTKKNKAFFMLYKFPSMNIVLKEKGEYIKGYYSDNDDIYLFVR